MPETAPAKNPDPTLRLNRLHIRDLHQRFQRKADPR